MISPNELWEWEEEAREAKVDRLRTMVFELLQDSHRLRHLIELMADFRHSKEHSKTMEKLDKIGESLDRPKSRTK